VQSADATWKDLPDYILGVTHEIWESRRIHALKQYYANDIIVRSPASVVVGNDGVIAATMATLAEFPDRQLLGEDVIWYGNDAQGFLSSHRLLSTASHVNAGVYGEPTGKTLRYRIIADCAVKDDVIYDEWLVRDQGAIVRQLGLQPADYARDLIAREGGPEQCVAPLSPDNDKAGEYVGTGNGHELGCRYADLITRIMNADMSTIATQYDRACQLALPGGVDAYGRAAADQFWMGLRASFPTAQFSVDHAIGLQERDMPPRASVRWSLVGSHDGWGSFGVPSGAMVYILGIGHAEFGPRGLRREWVLTDETAIWKQIVLHTG